MIFPALRYIDNESMSANITGIPFRIELYTIVTIQPEWTGTPNGRITIQGSVDHEEPITWVDLPEGSVNTGGVANAASFNYSQMGWICIRAIYTRTGGTGSLTVKLSAK